MVSGITITEPSIRTAKPPTACSPPIVTCRLPCAFLESRLAAGLPDKVTIDKSGANRAALEALKEETGQEIEIRQIRYLNNRVEQDHRAIKRMVRPMPGFKSFRSSIITLQGIELMHMIKKGQRVSDGNPNLSIVEQFDSLAA